MSKKLFSPPSGNADFIFRNFATFAVSIVLSGAIIKFIPTKFLIILIPILMTVGIGMAVI